MLDLRNALVHFTPETSFSDEEHRLEAVLRDRRLTRNPLVASGNPWWPDQALSRDTAHWAHVTALSFADTVFEQAGVRPNYQRLAEPLFGHEPGTSLIQPPPA